MSSPKQSKTGLAHLLTVGNSGPRFVPPVLREVGKLAAGVASVSTTGSATGNPRNKCVLKPGHSPLDWVRLSTAQDLSGLGDKAGTLEVTLEELAKHNSITDGWLAINGKVYNVTRYFPFHPGGVDELKQGLGKDATALFLQAHNWVNSNSLLKSCHVGRLVVGQHLEPLVIASKETEKAKEPQKEVLNTSTAQGVIEMVVEETESAQIAPNDPIDIEREDAELPKESPTEHSFQSLDEDPDLSLSTTNQFTSQSPVVLKAIPSFVWVQKTASLCIGFVGKPFSNPLVECWKTGDTVTVMLRYDKEDKTVMNEILFEEEIIWPGVLRVREEEGRVELNVKKAVPRVWYNYGVLKQTCKAGGLMEQKRTAYVLTKKEEIAQNVFSVELTRRDGSQIYTPVGYHFRVFNGPDDESISRSYTPIPNAQRDIFPKVAPTLRGGVTVNLLVKKYETGNISKFICDSQVGSVLYMSRPQPGGPTLSNLYYKTRFLMIAAGTGLTPMLSLMQLMLQRRIKKCLQVGLLICNKNIQSTPFLKEFEHLVGVSDKEKRIRLKHILSDPEESIPEGDMYIKGHITEEIVGETLDDVCRVKGAREEDYFVFVCGPPSFNDVCLRYLSSQSVPNEQIHVFEG